VEGLAKGSNRVKPGSASAPPILSLAGLKNWPKRRGERWFWLLKIARPGDVEQIQMPKLCESISLRAGDLVNISMKVVERDPICLCCALDDCVGVEDPVCPLRLEQRRRWRESNKQRAEYLAKRDQRQQKPRKEKQYDVRICR